MKSKFIKAYIREQLAHQKSAGFVKEMQAFEPLQFHHPVPHDIYQDLFNQGFINCIYSADSERVIHSISKTGLSIIRFC